VVEAEGLEHSYGNGWWYSEKEAKAYWKFYSGLITQYKPGYVLLANDLLPLSRFSAVTANAIGIKTLSLQHGLMTDIYLPIFAQKMGVYSEWEFEFLTKKHRILPERIEIVGNPSWDYLAEKQVDRESDKILVFSQLGLKEVFGIDEEDTQKEFVKAVYLLSETFKEYKIIVRLHPNDTVELFNFYFHEQRPNIVLADKNTSIKDQILDSKITISINSTAAYESLLLKRPSMFVILNKNSKLEIPGVFLNHNHCYIIKTSEQLVATVKEVIGMSKQDYNWNNKLLVSNFGYASERVNDLLDKW